MHRILNALVLVLGLALFGAPAASALVTPAVQDGDQVKKKNDRKKQKQEQKKAKQAEKAQKAEKKHRKNGRK